MRVITKEKRPSSTPVTVSNDSPPRHKRALTRKEQKQPCQFEWSVKCMFWIMAHYLESSGCSGLLLSSCHHHRLSLSLLYIHTQGLHLHAPYIHYTHSHVLPCLVLFIFTASSQLLLSSQPLPLSVAFTVSRPNCLVAPQQTKTSRPM